VVQRQPTRLSEERRRALFDAIIALTG